MAYQDKTLKCKDCNKEFTWTTGEQEFFAQKGFDRAPIRCPECRKKKKEQHQQKETKGELSEITCSECGKKTEVDFKPRNPQDILCSQCFEKKVRK